VERNLSTQDGVTRKRKKLGAGRKHPAARAPKTTQLVTKHEGGRTDKRPMRGQNGIEKNGTGAAARQMVAEKGGKDLELREVLGVGSLKTDATTKFKKVLRRGTQRSTTAKKNPHLLPGNRLLSEKGGRL